MLFIVLCTVHYPGGPRGLTTPRSPPFFCLFFPSISSERGEALGGGGALLSSLFVLYSLPLFLPFPLSNFPLSLSIFPVQTSRPGLDFPPLMVRFRLFDRTWPVDRIFYLHSGGFGSDLDWAGQGGKEEVAPCLDSFLSCLTLAWFGLAVGWW